MSFNFAPTANQESAIKLIPAGTLALALINVKEVGFSKNTGCLQAKIEFVISRGPYENRKIWMYIGDPNHPKCSEGWKPMCLSSLQHMLESCGIFKPDDASSYMRFEKVPAEEAFQAIMQDLDGRQVAVKLKIEKGTDGNDDKNAIGAILSPNQHGRTHKAYASVLAGDDLKAPEAASTNSVFGQPVATAPAAAQGGFAQPAAPDAAAGSTAPGWLQG